MIEINKLIERSTVDNNGKIDDISFVKIKNYLSKNYKVLIKEIIESYNSSQSKFSDSQIKILEEFFIDQINELKNEMSLNFNKNSIFHISQPFWTDLLNNLSNRHFNVINAYCDFTLKFVNIIKEKDQDFAYKIVFQLNQTNCNETLKKSISEKYKLLDLLVDADYSASKEKSLKWYYYVIAAYLIIRLIRYYSII